MSLKSRKQVCWPQSYRLCSSCKHKEGSSDAKIF